MFVETLNCIGVSIFTFIVLPSFDPVTASVVYLGIAMVPSILDALDEIFSDKNYDSSKKFKKLICKASPFIGMVLQFAGIVFLSIYSAELWLILSYVVSCLCISVRHWQNFVTVEGDGFFRRVKKSLHKGKTKIECLAHLWKVILTFVIVICMHIGKVTNMKEGADAIFGRGQATFRSAFGGQKLGNDLTCWDYAPYVVALVKIISDYMYYKASKIMCVINCQKIGFGISTFIIPIAASLSLWRMLRTPEDYKLESVDLFLSDIFCWQGGQHIAGMFYAIPLSFALFYFSYGFIVRHIWQTHGYKHGETTRIFVTPFYCGITLEISMLLNRRRRDKEYDIIKEQYFSKEKEQTDKENDPMLFICCATMWHETKNEMLQLMKSIYRLDLTQYQTSETTKKLGKDSKHFEHFNMEAHIFFDDAFEPLKEGETYADVNQYVKTLTFVINQAAEEINGPSFSSFEGVPYKTPYGGRLEYTMPGDNILIVHLKDKEKIRHKKRWSQVMYMFYILKHKLKKLYKKQKYQKATENTYLLALDGDVDFKPEAVLSLARRMKKYEHVGAACGRIHPIGSGPMVWYQQFEYAISHWLQKATEHVIGCVLCSPGCFSLFRGSALLQADVIKNYTRKAEEATQSIQYDQGEDRWLCTLLLKEGWRIEYCAESDAYTYAPEGFYEFYNQRRRWTPSTMANILDLILDWKNVTKKNQNISFLYITYQALLLTSTLLTPGTTFMIVLGAIIVGFETIAPWLALLLNILPVGVFLLLCLYASEQRQLHYAAVLSCVYTIVMAVVLIGVVKDAVSEGLCSMTTIFIIFVAGVFVVSALVHPTEVLCILPGLLYFLAIPSMSMLLFLYAIGNLHVVSWGTRETKQQSDTEPNASKHTPEIEEKGYFCSLGKWVHCMFCPTNMYNKDDFLYKHMMNEIHKTKIDGTINTAKNCEQPSQQKDEPPTNKESVNNDEDEADDYHIYFDDSAGDIDKKEKQFWKHKLKKYLQPLKKNVKKEEKVEEELIRLRNQVCLFIYLVNAIVITIMFGLTQVSTFKDSLNITFPCGGKYGTIVPIAFLFTVVFGVFLLIQFVCMLYHRFSTLVHITASTDLRGSISDAKQKLKDVQELTKTTLVEDEALVETDKHKSVLVKSIKSMRFSKDKKKKFSKLSEVVKDKENKLNRVHPEEKQSGNT